MRTNAPNDVTHIVCNEQCTLFVERDPNWSAISVAVRADEAAQHIDWQAAWLTGCKRYEDDFISAAWFAILGAVLPDEHAVAYRDGQRGTDRRRQA